MSNFEAFEHHFCLRTAQFHLRLFCNEKGFSEIEQDLTIFNHIKMEIISYKQTMNPNETELMKLDAMLASASLMTDFCVPLKKKKIQIEEIDIEKMKYLLKTYLRYPHVGVVALSMLCGNFTDFNYFKIGKILLDMHTFETSEVKQRKINLRTAEETKEIIPMIDWIVLKNKMFYLFKLYFVTPDMSVSQGVYAEKMEFDLKVSSILNSICTDAMKTSLLGSISSYEEALEVAQLLLDINREILLQNVEKESMKLGVPFLDICNKRMYENSLLKAMIYSVLPYYTNDSKLKLKLAKKAYSLCLEYYKNLPDDAHCIDQIETLQMMELSLEFTLDAELDTSTIHQTYKRFEKIFKVKIELQTIIKNNNLQADYFKTYYRNGKMFQSVVGFLYFPEVTKGCEIFAEFMKTNKKASEMFRKDTGAEFDESKMTIAELIDLMKNTKSRIFMLGYRVIDINPFGIFHVI